MSRTGKIIALALALTIALAVAGVTVPLALTYSGYCRSEGRWVSDEEKTRSAIVWVFQRQDRLRFRTINGRTEAWHPTAIHYKTLDEFLEANENCCGIGPLPGDDFTPPTFLTRLFGTLTDVVVVSYTERYVDDSGVTQSERVVRQVEVNVCGRVVD
jgi:hypothetical protein